MRMVDRAVTGGATFQGSVVVSVFVKTEPRSHLISLGARSYIPCLKLNMASATGGDFKEKGLEMRPNLGASNCHFNFCPSIIGELPWPSLIYKDQVLLEKKNVVESLLADAFNGRNANRGCIPHISPISYKAAGISTNYCTCTSAKLISTNI